VTEVFVDTSALLALLGSDDRCHLDAKRAFDELERSLTPLCSSSYVLVETYALLQRRMGLDSVRVMRDHLAPLLEIVWVDQQVHGAALDHLLNEQRRQLSLVDAVSFQIMTKRGIPCAFAYDQHFVEAGFELL
jgi:predicted nucleic acid-binding protein